MSQTPTPPARADTSATPDARDLAPSERLVNERLVQRENGSARAQFHQEQASISEAWKRLLELGQGVFADHNVRRAALNLLEDTEISRRREEEEATGRERAEAARTASELRYRTLFESIDEGFCIVEVIFDAAGDRAIDYRFLEANPAFARHTALANAVGRTMRELAPAHEESWFEIYGRIARTGQPARFEGRADALGREFDVYAFRLGAAGENLVAILFSDISERKRRDANLAFLNEISEDLARVSNVEQAMNLLGEKISRHFGVWRCSFAGLGEATGEATVRHKAVNGHQGEGAANQAHPLRNFITADFYEATRAGNMMVVRDTRTDPRTNAAAYAALGAQAFLTMPFVRDGEWRATLSIADSKPRDWREDEIELMRELTTRIWTRLERVRGDEALRASEQRLQRMVNVPQVGVLTFDLRGTLLHANNAVLEMLGYTRAQFDAKSWAWRDFIPPEEQTASADATKSLPRMARSEPYEKEFIRQDGTRLWLMLVAADLGDGTICEYAIDISGRKNAEAAVRASEEQFRRAIEDAPTPVIMYAEDGQVLQISRTWTELTGYTQEDIPTCEAWLTHAYGFGTNEVRERMHGVFTGKEPRQQFELQIQTRSGEGRDWEFTISTPGRLVDGRRFAVGMVNDLTERNRAERELRNSEERLREADRRKNQFLAMLGHELRNPLAAIHGGVALMRSEKTQEATRERMLPIVADQVAHMERLVDELLDVSRIVAGRVQLRQERVTVQDILRNALNMVQTQIEPGGFDIQQRVISEPLTVYGDPVRLSQIVVNVLGNAMKYSGESRRIDLSASSAEGAAVISIRDYGQGIAPQLLPRIFEPFMQATPAVTLKEGLGLGLAVVRQLVELHGGRVDAFSAGERMGSEFVIHLPLAADPG